MQFIHGDIWEYRTKLVAIGVGDHTFTFRVGVVPCLDCGILIGHDYPILMQLLKKAAPKPKTGATTAMEAETHQVAPPSIELPVTQEDLAQLT